MTRISIAPELLDQLLANDSKPEDLTGEDGLFKQLKKALIERALGAELSNHLGYEKGDPAGRGTGNNRNGTSSKTLLTEDGEVEIAVPRDRVGSFEPQLIPKGQTRFDGFDEKILSLYARGMTVREIQGHLAELYGVEVSPDLVSRVTDAVLDEVREWQNRPLDPVYPVVFFDALRVKIRDEGLVKNKAVYVALAFNTEGGKEVLGLWIEQTEGAKLVPAKAGILAQGDERTESPGSERYSDRRRGRPERLSGSDHDGLSPDAGSNLHCAPDPQQSCLRHLERPKSDHAMDQGHLSGREC